MTATTPQAAAASERSGTALPVRNDHLFFALAGFDTPTIAIDAETGEPVLREDIRQVAAPFAFLIRMAREIHFREDLSVFTGRYFKKLSELYTRGLSPEELYGELQEEMAVFSDIALAERIVGGAGQPFGALERQRASFGRAEVYTHYARRCAEAHRRAVERWVNYGEEGGVAVRGVVEFGESFWSGGYRVEGVEMAEEERVGVEECGKACVLLREMCGVGMEELGGLLGGGEGEVVEPGSVQDPFGIEARLVIPGSRGSPRKHHRLNTPQRRREGRGRVVYPFRYGEDELGVFRGALLALLTAKLLPRAEREGAVLLEVMFMQDQLAFIDLMHNFGKDFLRVEAGSGYSEGQGGEDGGRTACPSDIEIPFKDSTRTFNNGDTAHALAAHLPGASHQSTRHSDQNQNLKNLLDQCMIYAASQPWASLISITAAGTSLPDHLLSILQAQRLPDRNRFLTALEALSFEFRPRALLPFLSQQTLSEATTVSRFLFLINAFLFYLDRAPRPPFTRVLTLIFLHVRNAEVSLNQPQKEPLFASAEATAAPPSSIIAYAEALSSLVSAQISRLGLRSAKAVESWAELFNAAHEFLLLPATQSVMASKAPFQAASGEPDFPSLGSACGEEHKSSAPSLSDRVLRATQSLASALGEGRQGSLGTYLNSVDWARGL